MLKLYDKTVTRSCKLPIVAARLSHSSAKDTAATVTAKPIPTLSINSELPKDLTSIPTHELFVKSGFFVHPRPGLVHWLPIGYEILTKVESIIRSRMVEIQGEEVSMSSLSSSHLWLKTGRWSNTELYKLKDSSDDEYCLAATCEEEITSMVKGTLKSYKELPQLYFQINKKYRDEKRPRSGLLRGREFVMKDAYSFDINEASALDTYEKVVGAYYKIFEDLKIPFVKADADTGDIGGSLSHEWHYLHKSAGEDTLFTCDSCGNSSNIEKTLSYPEDVQKNEEVSVEYFVTKDESTLVCAYYPQNRTLEANLLKVHVPDINLTTRGKVSEEELLAPFRDDEEALMTKKVIRIMDSRLDQTSRLPDFPVPFINRSFISTMFDTPIVDAVEGEICGVCEDGKLSKHKSIEVGHTFYLGDKYSKPLELEIDLPVETTVNGKKKTVQQRSPVVMGCYGIGVSRIIAAVGEITRDASGFRWPAAIAPWSVTVIGAGKKDGNSDNLSVVFDALTQSGASFRFDDRASVGLGKKVRDSNLVGIPLSIIVGKKFPQVEIEVRGQRYGAEEEAWRQLWSQKKDEYQWEVSEKHGADTPEKHTVHVDGFSEVVRVLLEDM